MRLLCCQATRSRRYAILFSPAASAGLMSTGDALARLAARVDFLASSLANETAARLQLEAASAGDSVALRRHVVVSQWSRNLLNAVWLLHARGGRGHVEEHRINHDEKCVRLCHHGTHVVGFGYGFAFGDGNALHRRVAATLRVERRLGRLHVVALLLSPEFCGDRVGQSSAARSPSVPTSSATSASRPCALC